MFVILGLQNRVRIVIVIQMRDGVIEGVPVCVGVRVVVDDDDDVLVPVLDGVPVGV